MANVIILIHGLGNKPSKTLLESWWKQAMIEGLKTNKHTTLLPKVEMVYWADLLYDSPLDEKITDINNPHYLGEKYVKSQKNFPIENHDTRKKIIDFLNRQINRIFLNDDLSLNYSFIADSIINNYFKDLERYYNEKCFDEDKKPCDAKYIIRQRLLKVLEKYKNEKILLVAHSMGSIVAFDVISSMAQNISIDTLVTMGSPLGLPVIVSNISQELKLKSRDQLKTPPNIKNWYNFSDLLDKIAFNYKLSDDYAENEFGVKPIDSLVINNYEINGIRNPHKSFGYLRTPEFAKILNDFILSEDLNILEKALRKTKKVFHTIKTKRAIRKEMK